MRIVLKGAFRGAIVGAIVLTVGWVLFAFLRGTPSGWSGMEVFYVAPFAAAGGAGIGALVGAMAAWADLFMSPDED